MIKTYIPRVAILAQIESMVRAGLILDFCLSEVEETYNLSKSEVVGFKNCYLFLNPCTGHL